jgi:hypothetical protein
LYRGLAQCFQYSIKYQYELAVQYKYQYGLRLILNMDKKKQSLSTSLLLCAYVWVSSYISASLLLAIKSLRRPVIMHITGIWRSIVLLQLCFTFEGQTAPCTMNWQGVTSVKMLPHKNINIFRHHCGSISLLYSVDRFPTWPSASPTFPMPTRIPFEIRTSESQRRVVMRARWPKLR